MAGLIDIVNRDHHLTEREKDILRQLSNGKSLKQIGVYQTMKNQLMSIRIKLDAETSMQAMANAIRRGIIE